MSPEIPERLVIFKQFCDFFVKVSVGNRRKFQVVSVDFVKQALH